MKYDDKMATQHAAHSTIVIPTAVDSQGRALASAG